MIKNDIALCKAKMGPGTIWANPFSTIKESYVTIQVDSIEESL